MEEIWKNIEGYEGLYQISNYGKIKNLKNAKILKQYLDKSKNPSVNLLKNSKQKRFYVARLVAQAFIPNINNSKTVRNKDGNGLNNYVDNIEWIIRKTRPKSSIHIILCKELGLVAYSCNEMAHKLKLKGYDNPIPNNIGQCILNKIKYHRGLSFIDIKEELLNGSTIEELKSKYYIDKKSKNCKIENCKKKSISLGYCSEHYYRFKRYGNPLFKPESNLKNRIENSIENKKDDKIEVIKVKRAKKICSINGCNKTNVVKHEGKYYCHLHRDRIAYWGDPYNELKEGNNHNNNICLVEGCSEKSLTSGYCIKHYKY